MKLELKSMSTLELLKLVKKEAMTTAAHTEFLNELIEREVKTGSAIKELKMALAEVEADERLGYPTATVFENAPLALVQCGLENQRRVYKFVLKILNEVGLIDNEVNNKIIHPIGWAAGRKDEVFQVLWNISIEMMGHRSDLREEAIREEHKAGGIPLFAKMDAAELLEKYAVAVTIAALQIMTPDQRSHCHIDGLEELTKKYGLFLPDFNSAAGG